MVRIMIVDDELSAGNILRLLIEKHIPGDKVIKICRSAQEALGVISVFDPSLIMLDVEMPNMNGFDLLNKAGNGNFDVIFTTAYDKYAIKAIRLSALDYLLKPIDISELQSAINRHIIKKEFPPQEKVKLVNNLIHNLNQNDQLHFKLALSTSEGIFFIDPNEIIRCEGDNNYTHFHLKGRSPIIVSKTLKEYEEILVDYGFIRIHKSHLVNIRHVVHLDKEGMLRIKDGISLPVSRRRKGEVLRLLSEKMENGA